MKERKWTEAPKRIILLLVSLAGCLALLADYLPRRVMQGGLLLLCGLVMGLVILWDRLQKKQTADFANDICDTVDALMEEREPENLTLYEDTAASKVQGKLLQYYEKMKDGYRQSAEDKQTIQALVSDISHQVKTPIANIQMFLSILQQHELAREKQEEFLHMMAGQIRKLDFLMESLIKMSRLETGTFSIHMEENRLYDTIAQAVSSIWTKAEQKNIELDVDCDSQVTVRHDAKWTAEALANLLDNAVKYTPEGGSVHVSVRPWQFYTRIDIADSGIGIAEEHYNHVFQRFFRAQEAAGQEGVGLGLYLARGIITRQNGYMSVKSKQGAGTVFSVYLLS